MFVFLAYIYLSKLSVVKIFARMKKIASKKKNVLEALNSGVLMFELHSPIHWLKKIYLFDEFI